MSQSSQKSAFDVEEKEEDISSRKDILQNYKCPHKYSPNGNAKVFAIPCKSDCPFGHDAPDTDPSVSKLSKIPPWICRTSLVFECSKAVSTYRDGNFSVSMCTDGYHLKNKQLLELEKFIMVICKLYHDAVKPKQGAAVETSLNKRLRSISPENIDCCICLSAIKPPESHFGFLEKCQHVFCSQCILKWFDDTVNEHQNQTCPLCRTVSHRVLIWPKSEFESEDEKDRVFEQQAKVIAMCLNEEDAMDLSTRDTPLEHELQLMSSGSSSDDELAQEQEARIASNPSPPPPRPEAARPNQPANGRPDAHSVQQSSSSSSSSHQTSFNSLTFFATISLQVQLMYEYYTTVPEELQSSEGLSRFLHEQNGRRFPSNDGNTREAEEEHSNSSSSSQQPTSQ